MKEGKKKKIVIGFICFIKVTFPLIFHRFGTIYKVETEVAA
jgi:hypothetical protein